MEVAEVASGEFGVVKQARHRLDGIVYAVKISKNKLRINSHDEKMAMKQHTHIVFRRLLGLQMQIFK